MESEANWPEGPHKAQLDALDDLARCPICHDFFKVPLTLGCGHACKSLSFLGWDKLHFAPLRSVTIHVAHPEHSRQDSLSESLPMCMQSVPAVCEATWSFRSGQGRQNAQLAEKSVTRGISGIIMPSETW